MKSAPDGSVARRDSPRPDLLVFEVTGRITERDIEWMSSITDGLMQVEDQFDMLVIMANFEGLDLGAAFDTYAAKVMTRSIGHIRRYVVVGAPKLAEAMIKTAGIVLPVEARTFGRDEEAAAWAFLAGSHT